jgi:hypothetical protein
LSIEKTLIIFALPKNEDWLRRRGLKGSEGWGKNILVKQQKYLEIIKCFSTFAPPI